MVDREALRVERNQPWSVELRMLMKNKEVMENKKKGL